MSHMIRKAAGWTVGAFAGAALAIGASVAFATPANARACQYDGLTFMGEQPSYYACVSACYAVHGEDLQQALWGQTNHCCRCLY